MIRQLVVLVAVIILGLAVGATAVQSVAIIQDISVVGDPHDTELESGETLAYDVRVSNNAIDETVDAEVRLVVDGGTLDAESIAVANDESVSLELSGPVHGDAVTEAHVELDYLGRIASTRPDDIVVGEPPIENVSIDAAAVADPSHDLLIDPRVIYEEGERWYLSITDPAPAEATFTVDGEPVDPVLEDGEPITIDGESVDPYREEGLPVAIPADALEDHRGNTTVGIEHEGHVAETTVFLASELEVELNRSPFRPNQTARYTVYASADGETKNVTELVSVSSDDTRVLTVDRRDPELEAVSAGRATLSVHKHQTWLSEEQEVRVERYPDELDVDVGEEPLAVGEHRPMVVTATHEDDPVEVSFDASPVIENTSVATFEYGQLLGAEPGETTLEVTYGDRTVETAVEVVPAADGLAAGPLAALVALGVAVLLVARFGAGRRAASAD